MSACAKSPPPRRGPSEARRGPRHASRAERGGAAGGTLPAGQISPSTGEVDDGGERGGFGEATAVGRQPQRRDPWTGRGAPAAGAHLDLPGPQPTGALADPDPGAGPG